MSQYTIEMNYETLESTKGIEFKIVKPIFQALMQNLVKEFNEVGWTAHANDNENNFRIRFWLSEGTVKEMVEKEVRKTQPKFRAIFLSFLGNFFGDEAKKKFYVIEKEVIAEKIKEGFSEGIEQQLLGFKGMPGFSVMKGSKNLFEEKQIENNNKKVKP